MNKGAGDRFTVVLQPEERGSNDLRSTEEKRRRVS